MSVPENSVLITKDRLAELERDQRKLRCLQAAGIDNTEAYAEGMRIFHQQEGTDEEEIDPEDEEYIKYLGNDSEDWGPSQTQEDPLRN